MAGNDAAPRTGALRWFALLLLCAAYVQGPLTKILDFPGALAEMTQFGLTPAPLFAIGVIVFELTATAMILTGRWRWLAALALAGFTLVATFIAIRFWEMPAGQGRMMATNSFFEHLGLIGGFILVALDDLGRRKGVAT
ncbi:DoxX family protein [Hyphomicrobiales bacterium]|nr:DoxX family protein [Hyphomicrobiales bacterium]CAH1697336.1 DoxX family protein [Hyphomicrobiales bacterium]CAI0345522.1 DoxX family protein [Hyphomicrobiales bacterium]